MFTEPSKIKSLIKQKGPISIDEMMVEAVLASSYSYYQRQEKLGEGGDFTTAPEISQLFGEILALWAIDKWYKLGSPNKINLVELGPGYGTLMRDLLNVAKLVPEFYHFLQVELVEINPHFINKQKVNLQQFNCNRIKHLIKVEDISSYCSIIIANEFFDALPIKQYIKSKDLWHEIIVIINPVTEQLMFDKGLVGTELQNHLLEKYPQAGEDAIVEISSQALDTIKFISKHIGKYKGASLIIDYGYEIEPLKRSYNQYNSTLQAIMNHQYCPILETLGEADLSAHVDFYELKTVTQNMGINILKTLTQRDFLIKYGILLRSQNLWAQLSAREANIISNQVDRLISPSKMGLLFKALTLISL